MSLEQQREFKERVRTDTDIVGLIGESVQLTPHQGGSVYKGLCPFHDDTNPSFDVRPDKQYYRCWVCDEGGDVFSYVMKTMGFGFREALEYLAQRAGVEIPTYSPQQKEQSQKRAQLVDVLTWARDRYHDCLKNSAVAAPAREYLASRGIFEDTINRYQLGFHPADQWQWLIDQSKDQFEFDQLIDSRLVRQSEKTQRYYDDFVGRVLFPIHNMNGRCVAFGGRKLPGIDDDRGPKYLNSAESPIFKKSDILYGLDTAMAAIRSQGTAIVMEGYTDCILSAVAGVENAVATLGTALTANHVQLLKRFTRKIVLVYDGDTAGQNASERAITQFLGHEIDVRILTLPEDSDPADFLAAEGRDAFDSLVSRADEAWVFKLDSIIKRIGSKSVDERHQVLTEMVRVLADSPNLHGTSREDLIIGDLAQRLRIREQTVRAELNKVRRPTSTPEEPRFQEPDVPGANNRNEPEPEEEVATGARVQEQEVLEMILACPERVIDVRRRLGEEHFQVKDFRRLWQRIIDFCEERGESELTPARLRDDLAEQPTNLDLMGLIVRLEAEADSKGTRSKLNQDPGILYSVVDRIVSRWEYLRHDHEINELLAKAKSGGSTLTDEARLALTRKTESKRIPTA